VLEIPEYGENKEGDEVMDQIRQDAHEDLVDLCDILESISIVSTSRVMANAYTESITTLTLSSGMRCRGMAGSLAQDSS
jgi:hypothetical protein